jgi:DNA transformation protein and related proteins
MAKAPSPLVEHCVELFALLGAVRPKSMFGGWGFYLDEMFFALIADETLYLKVDGETEGAFRDAGSWPFTFTYKDGRSATMAYWSAPEEAMESPAMMRDWARLAVGAALRAKQGKAPAKRAAKGVANSATKQSPAKKSPARKTVAARKPKG